MSKLGAILGLISLGRVFAATPLYKRFLSGVAAVICLTIVTGMVSGALLIGLFYGVYELFLLNGLESTPALITTFALGVLTLVVLVMCTLSHLRSLLDVPKMLMEHQHPIASRATSIAQAFIEGFTSTPTVRVTATPRNRWM